MMLFKDPSVAYLSTFGRLRTKTERYLRGYQCICQGKAKKKNARLIMSAMALVVGSVVFDATAKMWRMTMIGTGLTRLGGGSFLEYVFSIRSKLKSV